MMHSLSPVPRTMASYSSFMLSQIYQGCLNGCDGQECLRWLITGCRRTTTWQYVTGQACNSASIKQCKPCSTARHHEPVPR
jgi:hypothetical protein